jgi:hypothetical protein
VSGFPEANRREARKLGLLRKQKSRSRTRASGAAGANERVCGECPIQVLDLMQKLVLFFSLEKLFHCFEELGLQSLNRYCLTDKG